MTDTPPASSSERKTPRVVVATTVALAFISFWRAAAIVLGDLASSMFYVGGIAEEAIGKSAPWFVLAVMLSSFAVRSIYLESASMFVRGGVYVVVRDSMGSWMARLSVSALIFDFLLTGPISSVSAGHYVANLLQEIFDLAGYPMEIHRAGFSMCFALLVTVYFWWNNIKGIHESSGKALRVMQITTVMVVMMLLWCVVTIALRGGAPLPPLPSIAVLKWGHHALGWFEGSFWPNIASIAFIIAFGHAFLSMSGFETLAQVYREISYPKLPNLKKCATVVCVYATVATGLITMFAAMIIPDDLRPQYYDNLIGGLAMHLAGPEMLKLGFHVFVVIVGALILSSAINTSIIGANSVLNRVAEDGVLLSFFRRPHHRYGTTYRIINLIVILQLFTIVMSGGDVYVLGEAYAFGVVWSFCLKSLGVLVLRFQRHDQEYKTPFNLRIGKIELPIGLGLITLGLFLVAIANVFSKQLATIWGSTLTVLLFALFTISERINRKAFQAANAKGLEEFNLEYQSEPELEAAKPGQRIVLVAVRDYNTLAHLEWALNNPSLLGSHFVVMTARPLSAGGQGEHELQESQYFSEYERRLFTRVVNMAEKAGRTAELLVTPAYRPLSAIVQTAGKIHASVLVMGQSPVVPSEELARIIGLAWERLPQPRPPLSLLIVQGHDHVTMKLLGPHSPRLAAEDVERVHRLWLELSGMEFGAQLHHDAVVRIALKRLETDLRGTDHDAVLADARQEVSKTDEKSAS